MTLNDRVPLIYIESRRLTLIATLDINFHFPQRAFAINSTWRQVRFVEVDS